MRSFLHETAHRQTDRQTDGHRVTDTPTLAEVMTGLSWVTGRSPTSTNLTQVYRCVSLLSPVHIPVRTRRRHRADEDLRQRMSSRTDEFCEAMETLLEMHQSRLTTHLMTSQSAESTALLCHDDDNPASTLDVCTLATSLFVTYQGTF